VGRGVGGWLGGGTWCGAVWVGCPLAHLPQGHLVLLECVVGGQGLAGQLGHQHQHNLQLAENCWLEAAPIDMPIKATGCVGTACGSNQCALCFPTDHYDLIEQTYHGYAIALSVCHGGGRGGPRQSVAVTTMRNKGTREEGIMAIFKPYTIPYPIVSCLLFLKHLSGPRGACGAQAVCLTCFASVLHSGHLLSL
jgi:hypothetical protein